MAGDNFFTGKLETMVTKLNLPALRQPWLNLPIISFQLAPVTPSLLSKSHTFIGYKPTWV
jgi:hypothetical protein